MARLRLAPIFSAAVLLAAACSSGSQPPAPTPAGEAPPTEESGFTGIVGRTSVGPTCPVERRDSACPDRPYVGEVVALRLDGSEAGRAATDAAGFFSIPLPPGTYTVIALTSGPFPAQRERPTAIVVAGQTTEVDVKLDSGIR